MRLCQSSAGNYVVEHSRLGQAKNDELLQHTNYEYRKCMWAAMNDGGPTSNDLSMDLLNEIILKMERRRLADSTANTKSGSSTWIYFVRRTRKHFAHRRGLVGRWAADALADLLETEVPSYVEYWITCG